MQQPSHSNEPATPPAGGADGDPLVVTFSAPVADAVERMGRTLEVGRGHLVRRGLILLDLLVSLGDSEELVVHNKRTHQLERIAFRWDA
jgi:hypothetical protein